MLASGPGTVQSSVRSSGETVASAPVFIEPYDASNRQRLGDVRSNRTDMRGAYRFDILLPGAYRLLSTFEYQQPDAEVMSVSAAPSVQVETSANVKVDLDLYIIR